MKKYLTEHRLFLSYPWDMRLLSVARWGRN